MGRMAGDGCRLQKKEKKKQHSAPVYAGLTEAGCACWKTSSRPTPDQRSQPMAESADWRVLAGRPSPSENSSVREIPELTLHG